MSALFDFLQKNQIEKGRLLPAVHSTEAYFIKKFMKSGRIEPQSCKFFGGEKLSYFFLGRPAFKRTYDTEPDYWELPMCFIVQYEAIRKKRTFPFDSGAFKSGLYPTYISMMEIEEFDTEKDSEAAEKIIGTFFGTNRNYYLLKTRPKVDFEGRFDVGVLDEEIKALHKLVTLKDNNVDDRRFAIELQTEHQLELVSDTVLAVVLPESYIEDPRVVAYVEDELEAELITYPLYPLKKDYYYYAIYEKVDHFFRSSGFYRV
jgi:hypothetical protein